MTTQRVLVMHGEIALGADEHDNPLWYQLTTLDGRKLKSSYRGQATVANGRLYVGEYLEEYIIAEQPTENSVQYRAGYAHAMKQKRRVPPSHDKHESFRSGWFAAWGDKRPGT